MRFEFLIPSNEEEFEEFCLRYFRHVEKCGGLKRYGKRGEKQHGIDLLNLHATKPLLAVQCKRKERHKRLSKSEILHEVAEAEGCPHQV